MPGRVRAVPAEADLDYGNLVQMDDVDSQMEGTDAASVIGSCDVVNPAAIGMEWRR